MQGSEKEGKVDRFSFIEFSSVKGTILSMSVIEWSKQNKKVLMLGAALTLVSGCYLAYESVSEEKSDTAELLFQEDEETEKQDDHSEKEECTGVWVDIAGSVIMPGVYCLDEQGIIEHAILAAGGLKEDACQEWYARSLNRAQPLEPSMKLFVPSFEDAECVINTPGAAATPSSTAGLFLSGGCANGGININNATLGELDELPGVGASLGQRIIDARPFTSVDALDDVSGVGEATFEKLAPLVCI